MPALYREKIVSAFRDNAIKSVLLIDDHYLPYQGIGQSYINTKNELGELISAPADENETIEQLKLKLTAIRNIVNRSSSELMSSETAGQFVDFFHTKKLICDVENQTNNLDIDKIRKSDLIVLDYHLKAATEHNPAEHSLNLISELSRSKHMNVVVVFTAEDLKDVWREIAATLRGAHIGNVDAFFNNDERLIDSWNDFYGDWNNEWDQFYNANIEAEYLKAELNIEVTTNEFQVICEGNGYEKPEAEHVKWLLEKSVIKFNKNSKPLSNVDVHGKKDLWLQAGDVFIVLCDKTRASENRGEQRETTPEEVWEQIKLALVDWYPSFYRVITSELQNQIEDANFSMAKVISKGNVPQAAELWGILRRPESEKESAAQELLNCLLDDMFGNLSRNAIVIQQIISTANSIADNIPVYIDRNANIGENNAFLKQVISLANHNVTRTTEELSEQKQYEIAHAYNERLSTTPHHLQYFTTGSVLKDENNSWYLCVTPSCNTIPGQMTDRGIRDLTPHRQLTLAKLKKEESIITALQNAHQSSHLFITDKNGDRLAFGVIHPSTKLPDLIKVIVMNHDSNTFENGCKTVTFHKTKLNRQTSELEIKANKRKLTPIALLRPAYAARYQNIQSHYEGRIGVDFATLDLSIPDDTEH
ncbi:response regulator receiver domain [Shewanella xiamenensis]|uniref:response regulator receiver domain n=1 Tax=Shewanella xiamenensis TaxID=332186 RepID=UPI0035BB796A